MAERKKTTSSKSRTRKAPKQATEQAKKPEVKQESKQTEKPKRKVINVRTAKKAKRTSFSTHDGHSLTPLQARFIDEYLRQQNAAQAYMAARFPDPEERAKHTIKAAPQQAQRLLNLEYVTSEINHRLELAKSKSIADAQEVMEYFSKVMRGEIKDQFGLEAPLSERTRAAQELARRTVDIENRFAGRQEAQVVIKLDWERPDENGNQDIIGE